MSILIQPRHVKLWLAGHQENWPLAGYALKEIKQSFARIAAGDSTTQRRASRRPDRVGDGGTRSDSIDFAIKAGEPRHFREQYGKLTAGCNACHVSTGHPYIVIKVPERTAFGNQEFEPKR